MIKGKSLIDGTTKGIYSQEKLPFTFISELMVLPVTNFSPFKIFSSITAVDTFALTIVDNKIWRKIMAHP